MPQLDVWVLIATLAGFALYAAACALVYRYADAHAGDTADRRALPIMFAAAAVICILFSCLIENHNDLNTYNSWGQWILQNGVNGFYDTNEMAMPPLFLFLSAGLSGISNVTHIPYRIVYRLVFSAQFLLSAYVLYRTARKHMQEVPALCVTGLYLFCPALVGNCSIWGQTDAFTCMFTVLIVCCVIERKWLLSFVWLFLGISFKAQILFVIPCLAVWLIYKMVAEKHWLRLIIYAAGFAAAVWLSYLPFAFTHVAEGDVLYFIDVFLGLANNKSWFSSFALNFWSAIGLNLVEASSLWRYISYGAVIVLTAGLCVMLFRSKYEHKLFLAAVLQVMIVFNFCIAMLERYLMAVIPLMLLLGMLVKDKKFRLYGALITSSHLLGMVVAAKYYRLILNSSSFFADGVVFLFALAIFVVQILYVAKAISVLFPGFRPQDKLVRFLKRGKKKEQAAEAPCDDKTSDDLCEDRQ